MPLVGLIVSLLVVVVALALLARRIATPLPVLLVVGGLALGVVSQKTAVVPVARPPADLLFLVLLPPLLVSAAFGVPLGAFRANARPITLLAVGLVLATMVAVGETVRLLLPIPRAAAYVLGAIVAPPDPVAATSVARRLGLPSRIATILEGEGLVNDATALVAYHIAVAAVVTGAFAWPQALLEFVRSGPIGVAVGVACGYAVSFVLARLDDALLEPVVSLLAPYVAYLGADRLGGSGVLSAVALGFILRHRNLSIHEASTRIAMRRVWDTLVFVINGAVFVLIGMELGEVGAANASWRVVYVAGAVSAAAMGVRMAWMFVVPRIARFVTPAARRADAPSPRDLTVLGWAGMRGVVSLAAALSVPYVTAAGTPFPARGAILVLSYGVLFSTLVVQGLTLAPLIRWLGVADPDAARREESRARREAIDAAVDGVTRLERAGELRPAEARRLCDELRGKVGLGAEGSLDARYRAARDTALRLELETVVRLRADASISDEVSRRLEEELDVDTVRLRDQRRKSDPDQAAPGAER